MNRRNLTIFFFVVVFVFILNICANLVDDLENITKSPNSDWIAQYVSKNPPFFPYIIFTFLSLEKRAWAQEIEDLSDACYFFCENNVLGFINNRWCQFVCGECERIGVEPCIVPVPFRSAGIVRCKCGDNCCNAGELCCGRETGKGACWKPLRQFCCKSSSDSKACRDYYEECCKKANGDVECCPVDNACDPIDGCCSEGEVSCAGQGCCPIDKCADGRCEGCPPDRELCDGTCCGAGEKCCETINPRGETQYQCCPIGEELCGPFNAAGPEDVYGYHCCSSNKCCLINELYDLRDCVPSDSMSCCPTLGWCYHTEYCCEGVTSDGYKKTACCPPDRTCCIETRTDSLQPMGPFCCDYSNADCDAAFPICF